MNHKKLIKKLDNKAVDFLPMRIIVSIAIITAITGLTAYGLYSASINNSENQIDQQCKELISSLSSMAARGEPRDNSNINDGIGSIRVKEFNLPNNLLYLSFGVDPDPNNDGKLKTGLTEEGNVIFYRVEGGSKKTIWLDEHIKFREGVYIEIFGGWFLIPGLIHPTGHIIEEGGTTSITFEYIILNNESYVLIQSDDGYSGGVTSLYELLYDLLKELKNIFWFFFN